MLPGFPGAIDAFHLIIGQIVVIAGMTTVMLWWAKNSQQGGRVSFLKNNRQLVRAVFFYGYQLLRACLIAVTLGLQSKGVTVACNFYGQIVLAVVLFAGTAYLWCTQLRLTSYKRFLCLFLASGVIGIILASGLGWGTRHFPGMRTTIP